VVKSILARHQERVRYFGIIPRNELYRYYSQGSVLVMPSLQDGFGLVMSQAMACGLPVIATTNTGAMDLFTDGQEGFIVPIRSSEAIREKILMLKENRALHSAMSRAALERVRSIGGWNAYGERMLEVYREALAMRDRSQH
jgi:starch synthase